MKCETISLGPDRLNKGGRMIALLLGFLFGLRAKPVYNISFKNEILDVSIMKLGFPIFVSTTKDMFSIGFSGKRIFKKPKTGIFIPSSVYTLYIDKKAVEYLTIRGEVRNRFQKPRGTFLGVSKDLFYLFFKKRDYLSAYNYDGKLLYRVKTSGFPIIFPDGKLMIFGKKMALYNQQGVKIWERDNMMGENPEFIPQNICNESNNFILYNKFTGLFAGFDITGKIYWFKNKEKPISLSNNAEYFIALESKNTPSVYEFISGRKIWEKIFPENITSEIMLNNGYSILGGKNRAYIVNKKGDIQRIVRNKITPYKIFYQDSILTLIGKNTISVYKLKIK